MSYILYEHTKAKQKIFLIDMRSEPMKPFSELVQKGIQKYLKLGKRIAFLVNKKGYATGTFCNECGYIHYCKYCDIAVAQHKNDQGQYFGLCHICKRQYTYDPHCQRCGGLNTKMYGVGTQQVKERIHKQYGKNALIIESNTVNSPRKIKKMYEILEQYKILVGTSLLTQNIASFHIDLWIVVHADLGLNIPDFQANRNNFCFLYDLFKKHKNSIFLVQSYNPESPSIRYACKKDIKGMKTWELVYRKDHKYPPYTQMCVIMYKHEKEKSLYTITNKLYQELLFLRERYVMEDLEIYATPPLVYKKFGKFRYNIILKGKTLRSFMDIAFSKLKMKSRGFQIDREPQGII